MIVNLWMSWMSILAEKTKTPRKTQKKQQPKEQWRSKAKCRGADHKSAALSTPQICLQKF